MHYTPEDIARAETAGAADIARMFQNNGYNIKYVRNDYWQAIDPKTNRAIGIYADGAYDYYSGEKTHGMISTVMKYFDLRFPDAVASLLNKQLTKLHPITRENEKEKKTELKMPKNIGKPEFVEKYLCEKRKLPSELVKVFEEKELIFASKHDRFTNVCFVGKDYNGTPAFCSWRGTIGDKYRGNSPGSDKRFPFRWQGVSDKVYVFESPIDLMSYIALSNNEKWIEDNYVALSGIETSGLEEFLKRNTKIKEVYACLDNDDAGKEGNEKISKLVAELLPDAKVSILTPHNKDWNEDLVLGESFSATKEHPNTYDIDEYLNKLNKMAEEEIRFPVAEYDKLTLEVHNGEISFDVALTDEEAQKLSYNNNFLSVNVSFSMKDDWKATIRGDGVPGCNELQFDLTNYEEMQLFELLGTIGADYGVAGGIEDLLSKEITQGALFEDDLPSIHEQISDAEVRADAHNKNNIFSANLSYEHFKENEGKDI